MKNFKDWSLDDYINQFTNESYADPIKVAERITEHVMASVDYIIRPDGTVHFKIVSSSSIITKVRENTLPTTVRSIIFIDGDDKYNKKRFKEAMYSLYEFFGRDTFRIINQ